MIKGIPQHEESRIARFWRAYALQSFFVSQAVVYLYLQKLLHYYIYFNFITFKNTYV